jgi:hypothetical protein
MRYQFGENVLFATHVVVERLPAHPNGVGDLLRGGSGIALLGEQRRRMGKNLVFDQFTTC